MKRQRGVSWGLVGVFALVLCVASAAVKPGENILLNGTFEAEQADFPPYWNGEKKVFQWHPDGGPRGLPYISVHAHGVDSQKTRLKQFGLNLVSNGLYRVSMRVRTKDFTCTSHTGLIIINTVMWGATAGLYTLPGGFAFPQDTSGEWKLVSQDFHLFGSPEGYYAMLHISGQKGAIDVADVKLEALDERALSQTRASELLALQRAPRLVPCGPLLAKIPENDPVVHFRLYGELEGKESDYEAVLAVAGVSAETRTAVTHAELALPLPQGVTKGQMTVSLVRRGTAKPVFSRDYNFALKPTPEMASCAARQLNNFVTEVLASDLSAREAREFAFGLSRDSWAFVGVTGDKDANFDVCLDEQSVMNISTPRHETFRKLRGGRHALVVRGAHAGRVVVREIAEILNYCPGTNSKVAENPVYDWAYQEKHGLSAVTTELGGSVAPSDVNFRARGYQHFANLNLVGTDYKTMREKLVRSPGLAAQQYDGVACDEQDMSALTAIENYTRGFWQFDAERRPTRPIYTWAYGKMTDQPVHRDFLAACINVSGGEGKLLREIYCKTYASESEARAGIDRYVVGTFRDYRKIAPETMPSLGLVLGNFNQMPIISLLHHPEVDYKYYLDLQMNIAANDPVFRGIGLIGLWGSYYADDELHRWSLRLLRHYAVEGHTDMLGTAYGYSYCPNHVQNGDFRGMLAPWRVTGQVRVDRHTGFGQKSQGRFGGIDGFGDTFAVMVRGTQQVAQVSQRLKGLISGRMYCLQFATFDVRDVKANRVASRKFAIRATLGTEAEVDPKRSWVHVDRRTEGRYAVNNGVARINLHHVVFTARAEELDLTFDNVAATPGEELGVNFVSVNPYYAE